MKSGVKRAADMSGPAEGGADAPFEEGGLPRSCEGDGAAWEVWAGFGAGVGGAVAAELGVREGPGGACGDPSGLPPSFCPP